MTAIQEQTGLSTADVEQFWNDGFLVIDNVFSHEEVETLRDACASPQIVDALDKAGLEQQTVHLLGLAAKHPSFLELARSRRIINRLIPLIGPDIQLQHSKLAAKTPVKGKGSYNWHQDFAFFPHTNTDLVAVMVMLDDATPENGCMSMLRGSHKLGLRDHMKDGYFSAACQETHLWENHPEEVIPITPRAGGISIHHCLTLHGSPANESGRPRRGIVFQYRADDAFQLADAIFADTGLVVSGKRRECVRCMEGIVRLPRGNFRSEQPFGSAWNQEGEFARMQNGITRV